MIEHLPESLPRVPFDRSEFIKRQILRLAFMHELLQPDDRGEIGAVLLPADHDGDEIPETLEFVLTERAMWRLYCDDVLLRNREAFLTETPTGQIISGHMAMVDHLDRWASHILQIEQPVSLGSQPEPDKQSLAVWAIENLGIDIENVDRIARCADTDDAAYDAVALATAQIEGAGQELQAATLLLMAVPELQIGYKDQALYLSDERDGTWQVQTVLGNGLLVLTQTTSSSSINHRRVATIEEVLAWNDLYFVPDQASSVHDVPEATLKA